MSEELNLYPLHVFRVVAQQGSVTQAARELYISQPAVSFHVKAIEARYGELLFERTPRGVRLTPAGAIVLEQANRLFGLLEDIPAAVHAACGEVKDTVTVAASSTPGAYLVPRLLRRFQHRYPRAEPHLRVGDSAQVLAWLQDYEAPLGVVGETAETAGLVRELVGADELRLVVAGGDPLAGKEEVTSRELSGYTLFLREPGSSTRAGTEALLTGLLPAFRKAVTLTSTEAIKQMVTEGLGVSVLSSWATRLEEEAGLLRPVGDEKLRRERCFYLVRREDRPLLGVAAALWQCLTIGTR